MWRRLWVMALVAMVPSLGQSRPNPTSKTEVGAWIGTAFLSEQHELYSFPAVDQAPFRSTEPSFGLRLAHFPIAQVGAEAEFAFVPALSEAGPANIFIPRGHVIAQLPATVTPFVLAGVGLMALDSDGLGADKDPAFHWGLGVKANITETVMARIDGRHSVGPAVNLPNTGKLAHHLELLFGFSVALGGEAYESAGLCVLDVPTSTQAVTTSSVSL